jgi:hypothetical protein
VLELLVLGGRSLPHAVMMMVPEAWQGRDDMPEHLRAGVVAESLLLGTWDRARRRGSPGAVDLDPLERSRIDVVRQYVRLLRSLVLFAENELAPAS